MRLGPYFEEGGASGPSATAPAAPAAPAAEVPRDPQTGRFSKANIERIAAESPEGNVPQGTTAAVATQVPAATPEAGAAPAAPAAIPDAMASVDAFLAANPDAPEPTAPAAAPQAPAQPLTPELTQVRSWSDQQAAEAMQQIQVYNQLNQSMNRGDIEGTLSTFAPQAVDAMKEHFFQKHRDEFAQRIVDEGNGIKRDPIVGTLQQQVNALTQLIQSQQAQQTQTQAQQREQQILAERNQKLVTFMDGLYTTAGLKNHPQFANFDARLRTELQMNPQALQQIREGRFGAIGAKFRELLKEFQPVLTAPATTAQAAPQPGSTQLMTAAAGTSTTSQGPEKLATADGGINPRAFSQKLKSFLKAV